MVRVRDLVFRPFQEGMTRPTLVFEIIPNPTPPPPPPPFNYHFGAFHSVDDSFLDSVWTK